MIGFAIALILACASSLGAQTFQGSVNPGAVAARTAQNYAPVAGGTGTAFMVDTFTEGAGTGLELHTPEVGTIWGSVGTNTSFQVDSANDWVQNDNGPATYRFAQNPTLPTNANQIIECKGRTGVAAIDDQFGCTGRNNSDSSTFYKIVVLGDGQWLVQSSTAGSEVTFWNGVIAGFSEATEYTLKLSMIGTTLDFFIDGVRKSSGTNSTVTDTGFPGIYAGQSNSNVTYLYAYNP